MAAAAILNCYLVPLDHPRSLLHGPNTVLKFHVNSFTTFRDMDIWKFCKFGLKRLFPPKKFTFLGVLTPKHYFSSLKPPKGTSLGESASFKVYIVKIRPPVFAVGNDKKKKEREGKVHKVTSRLYFANMGSRSPWTDFHKNLQGCRGPWRNQSLQVWLQYFQGLQIYRGSKFPFSHWLCWSSLQQCCRYRAACDITA